MPTPNKRTLSRPVRATFGYLGIPPQTPLRCKSVALTTWLRSPPANQPASQSASQARQPSQPSNELAQLGPSSQDNHRHLRYDTSCGYHRVCDYTTVLPQSRGRRQAACKATKRRETQTCRRLFLHMSIRPSRKHRNTNRQQPNGQSPSNHTASVGPLTSACKYVSRCMPSL